MQPKPLKESTNQTTLDELMPELDGSKELSQAESMALGKKFIEAMKKSGDLTFKQKGTNLTPKKKKRCKKPKKSKNR